MTLMKVARETVGSKLPSQIAQNDAQGTATVAGRPQLINTGAVSSTKIVQSSQGVGAEWKVDHICSLRRVSSDPATSVQAITVARKSFVSVGHDEIGTHGHFEIGA